MAIGILGRKVGMTQVYDEKGTVIPVTVLAAGPCRVLQLKTEERDGYEAVQLGYLDKPRRLASRSERGRVASLGSSRRRAASGAQSQPKANCEPQRFVRELRGESEGYAVGQSIGVAVFHPSLKKLADKYPEEHEASPGDDAYLDLATDKGRKQLAEAYPEDYKKALEEQVTAVDVIGTSKGRGFSGVMKRHNFKGQRASHGVKKCHRHAGGTGCSAYPSRLFKGIRMAGQYGSKRCTVRNQEIAGIDIEKNLLLIRGAVPGPNGGYVIVKQTNKL